PSQKLQELYEEYGSKEIAFNKSIRTATGLDTQKFCLKIGGEHLPCILYSCSMNDAKVIMPLDTEAFEMIKRAKNLVNLRFAFCPKNTKAPIIFFVSSIIKGFTSFELQHESSYLVSLEFNQRPPDDLIETIGTIFQSIENFERRRELRITLDSNVVNDMEITSVNTYCVVDSIKRPCILKNLSASGCGIIMMCNPKFLINKKITIAIYLYSRKEPILLEGEIKRSEGIEGRHDLYLMGILLNSDEIPYSYKDMINSYIDHLESILKHKRVMNNVATE
ncbi:MAG: PilZ domain-containing protein, partial [Spirochaetales bacterium]|nr:PilZ domain-containing protein [Spirochaetales bacterium]